MSLDQLNQQFGVENHIHFEAGDGGLTAAVLTAADGSQAKCLLHGAHLFHFQPAGHKPVLYVSPEAVYRFGKALRGGVPVIWPWFGSHPDDETKPAHGIARSNLWRVVGSGVLDDGRCWIELELRLATAMRRLWPHKARLALKVTVGSTLRMELKTTNTDEAAFTITDALHSYFAIADIAQVEVTGLENRNYLDKVNGQRAVQQGAISVDREVDRIYFDVAPTATIHDRGNSRKIIIRSEGSRSTIVWNPWVAKSQRLGDFADDGYLNMICVETANAADNALTLAPGETHTLAAELSVTAA